MHVATRTFFKAQQSAAIGPGVAQWRVHCASQKAYRPNASVRWSCQWSSAAENEGFGGVVGGGRVPGFAFSGSGWLMPFHLGVAKELLARGFITNSTPLYGMSGGALAAMAVVLRLPLEEVADMMISVQNECNGRVFGRLDQQLRDRLRVLLPSDAHIQCNGKMGVGIIRVWPNPTHEAFIVSRFPSRDDLLDAVVASSYVPLYLGGRPWMKYRQMRVIDGGLVDLFPRVDNTTPVIPFKVPGFLLQQSAQNVIDPSLVEDFTISLPRLIWGTLNPMDESEQRELFRCGERAAEQWMLRTPS
eukprot:m.190218 g.190218  ORF g.190218 m.190218 type:complete len:302 (+) comp18548_c0_seq1:283-1188(+)